MDSNLKLTMLRHFTQQNQINVFDFTEHNICWDILPKQQQLADRTRGWWENSHWTTALNKCDQNPITHQPGRTGLGVFNELSLKALKPGSNELGLGQWSWVRLWGQSNYILLIVMAYRPCFSSGPLSTYQQVRYLAKLNSTESPKNWFLMDLEKAIFEWQPEENTVILIADMNDDVQLPSIQKLCSSVGLVDRPTTQHHSLPATYNWGNYPIDGIFLPMVDQCRTGYLKFGKAIPSDHRVVWLDIPVHFVCRQDKEAIEWPLAQCLHCKDSWVVTKYNELSWKSFQANDLAWRASNLTQQAKVRLMKLQ